MKKLIPFLLAGLLCSSAQAATLIFNGVLQGSQEVPANASAGTGSVSLSIDSVTRDWTLTGNFANLSANSSNAHIHGPALPGVSAGVIVGLPYTSGATSGSISGAGTFTVPQFNDLVGLKYYVNLHSTSFPGGELRAQLIPETSSAVLAASAGLFLLRRRR